MRGVNTMLGQLWDSRATRFWRNLILSSAVLLLLGSGVAWGADQANKMLSVAMNTAATNPTVTIKTAEPVGYRYTVYDSFEPTRVVVDFPGMEVSDIAKTISVNKGGIKKFVLSALICLPENWLVLRFFWQKRPNTRLNWMGKNSVLLLALQVMLLKRQLLPAKRQPQSAKKIKLLQKLLRLRIPMC